MKFIGYLVDKIGRIKHQVTDLKELDWEFRLERKEELEYFLSMITFFSSLGSTFLRI